MYLKLSNKITSWNFFTLLQNYEHFQHYSQILFILEVYICSGCRISSHSGILLGMTVFSTLEQYCFKTEKEPQSLAYKLSLFLPFSKNHLISWICINERYIFNYTWFLILLYNIIYICVYACIVTINTTFTVNVVYCIVVRCLHLSSSVS